MLIEVRVPLKGQSQFGAVNRAAMYIRKAVEAIGCEFQQAHFYGPRYEMIDRRVHGIVYRVSDRAFTAGSVFNRRVDRVFGLIK